MSAARTTIALLIMACIFYGALAMAGLDNLIETMNAITIVASVALLGVFSPLWWPALKGNLDGAHRLGLGIGLIALSFATSRAWNLVWRLAEYPEWMRGHWSVALWPFIGVLGCAVLVTVPSNVDGTVQRKSWVLLMISIGLGALVAGIVIGVRWADYIVGVMPG